jgi:hypothetical protein
MLPPAKGRAPGLQELLYFIFIRVKAYQQVNYPQMLRGSLWIFVDLCGSLWIFVDLCGSLWIFVDLCGYSIQSYLHAGRPVNTAAFPLEVGANAAAAPPPPNGFRALAAGKNFDIKTVTFSIS